ncbi:MAG: hypothetical protein ACTSWY_00220 [Promethearchaeota archaeon]
MGLKIFMGSLAFELEKLYGRATVNALIYRIGQKPGEIIANQILKKYNRTEEEPFKVPTAAYNLLENSITQLFKEELVEYKEEEDKYIIKIKNVCPLRQVIMSRNDLEFEGTLCQFSIGYFESALKILTGMNVSYNFIENETTDDFCMIEIVFRVDNSSKTEETINNKT